MATRADSMGKPALVEHPIYPEGQRSGKSLSGDAVSRAARGRASMQQWSNFKSGF